MLTSILVNNLTLAAGSNVLCCQHGGVGRAFIAISLDLHALLYKSVCVVYNSYIYTYTGDTGDGFAAGQIGNVDESIVEGSEDAGNAEDELAL
jgi:hypothetical protein